MICIISVLLLRGRSYAYFLLPLRKVPMGVRYWHPFAGAADCPSPSLEELSQFRWSD
jgi:hypothetical protein